MTAKSFRIVRGRSSSFTLAVIFTALLLLSLMILLYFIEQSSTDNRRERIAAMVRTDLQGLLQSHQMGGADHLDAILAYRLKQPVAGVIYGLLGEDGQLLRGNLPHVPKEMPADRTLFSIDRPGPQADMAKPGVQEDSEYAILAISATLESGKRLIVGRNIADFAHAPAHANQLGWVAIIILVSLAGAGFYIGDRVVYRINLIADTAHYIMQTGDLSKRIPVAGYWDDLSKLTHILNVLLQRIETLMEENRQVSDNVAHDLRTPLTRLKNQLEMLHDRGEDEQLGISECTEKLIAEADHILTTFSALLRIRNIESGKWRGEEEMVQLDALIHDVIDFYEPLAQDKEQTIEASVEYATVKGDKHLLFQAVANLLDNAIKYASHGAQITVSLCGRDHETELKVCNSGSYVDPANYSKIFQRFFRTDKARGTHAGTGLGLSLVQAIILLHNGRIMAENAEEGFCITACFTRLK